jgi:Origin of replication binding protein
MPKSRAVPARRKAAATKEKVAREVAAADRAPQVAPAPSEPHSRKLKLSVNPHMLDKHEGGDKRLFTHGWRHVEITVEELAEWVGDGRAFSAQFMGPRKASNFLGSDVVTVDVDGGLTIEEALAHPLIKDHSALLYTTVSHTEEDHRFRVVFAVPRTIQEPEEQAALARSLALRLSGDSRSVDATRISFGSRGARTWLIRKELSQALVDELVEQSLNQPRPDVVGGPGAGGARSALTLRPDLTVRLAKDETARFTELAGGTRMHCPFHSDRRPSAFVVTNRHGVHGIHCSTCGETFWPRGMDPRGPELPEFDAVVKEVRDYFERRRDYGPLFPSPEVHRGLSNANIQVVSGTPAPPELEPGVTFVKSPKGSGKTEAVKRLTKEMDRVLLIGHRRALINQSSTRVGLTSYLKAPGGPAGVRRRYGVCLDSLLSIPPEETYDAIILDESEQLFAHFLSETLEHRLGGGRSRIFRHFSHLVGRAKRVVALDADLGFVTFDTISAMAPGKPKHLWLNEQEPPEHDRVIYLYDNEAHLKAELKRVVGEGKRVYVTSNSKNKLAEISKAIAEEFPEAKQMVITSETARTADVKDFMAKIKQRCQSYHVILASPSIGTGVDITFPERAKLIDAVFGFFDAQITTHQDFDQQLGRVRDPGEVRVWVTPRRFNFETNVEAVKSDILEQALYMDLLEGYAEGVPRYREDPFIDMAALITSQQRRSKNALRRNFVEHKQAQGYDVRWVRRDAEQRAVGLGMTRVGRVLREADRQGRLENARPLNKAEYQETLEALEGSDSVSIEHQAAFERTAIELFYRRPISRELVQLDDGGKYRNRLLSLERITSEPLFARFRELPGAELGENEKFVSGSLQRALALSRLFQRTPLFRAINPAKWDSLYAFDAEALVTADDLGEFISYSEEHKPQIENLLGVEVGRQLRSKPMRQLNAVLRLVGLKVEKASTRCKGEKKIRGYRLSPHALETATGILRARRSTGAWAYVYRLHGWAWDSEAVEGPSDALDYDDAA